MQHPAETVINNSEENKEDRSLQIYADGSKTEKGVGSGKPYTGPAKILEPYISN